MSRSTWEYKLIECRARSVLPTSSYLTALGDRSLIINHESFKIEKGLKLLGDQGWELCGIQKNFDGENLSRKQFFIESFYIFKRPISQRLLL